MWGHGHCYKKCYCFVRVGGGFYSIILENLEKSKFEKHIIYFKPILQRRKVTEQGKLKIDFSVGFVSKESPLQENN